MKILSLIIFILAVLFSFQSSLAQDSSNYIPPVPKKTTRHKHAVKDSTASVIKDTSVKKEPSSRDTSIYNPPVVKKTLKHKSVAKDSVLKTGSISQDTLITTISHRIKSNKHQNDFIIPKNNSTGP